jgi:hypothetical protein
MVPPRHASGGRTQRRKALRLAEASPSLAVMRRVGAGRRRGGAIPPPEKSFTPAFGNRRGLIRLQRTACSHAKGVKPEFYKILQEVIDIIKKIALTAEDVFRENLLDEYATSYGKPDCIAIHLIEKAVQLERNIIQMEEKINEHGVLTEWKNGENQGGIRENPIVGKMNQTIEQQRKILAELKLTPASRKASAALPEPSDEFDSFGE